MFQRSRALGLPIFLIIVMLLGGRLAEGQATNSPLEIADPTLSLRENFELSGIILNEWAAVTYSSRVFDPTEIGEMVFAAYSFENDEDASLAMSIVAYHDRRPFDGHWSTREVTVRLIGDETMAMVFAPDDNDRPWEGKIVARVGNVVVSGRAMVRTILSNPVALLYPFVYSAVSAPADTALADRLPTYEMFDGGRFFQWEQLDNPDSPIMSALPTSTPVPTATATSTPSPTATTVPTPIPSSTPRPTPSPSPVPTATPIPTATPSPSMDQSDAGLTLTGHGVYQTTVEVTAGAYLVTLECEGGANVAEVFGDAIRRTHRGIQNVYASHPEAWTLDNGELHIKVDCYGAWVLRLEADE